jgi:hypothetical protein
MVGKYWLSLIACMCIGLIVLPVGEDVVSLEQESTRRFTCFKENK